MASYSRMPKGAIQQAPAPGRFLPREGFYLHPLLKFLNRTVTNPAIVLPLYLFLKYTDKGRELGAPYDAHIAKLKYLIGWGVLSRVNAYLNESALGNFKKDKYDWTGKEVVIVTGGAGGIGGHIVMGLARKGVKVVVLDVIPMSFDTPSNVHYFQCDITNTETIKTVANAIRQTVGEPTVLINNAGVARGKTILEESPAEIKFTFDVNALSHYYLAQEFLPHMIAHNHGMVVTVASLASYVGAPKLVDYASTKAAALSFHEGLTSELKYAYKADKVRTVCVTQNFTRTPLFEGFKEGGSFISPTLYAETVADEIVDRVLAGKSGHAVLPGSMAWITGVRGWSHWLQLGIREGAKDVMNRWDGRQVMDPSKRQTEPMKTK